MLKGLQDQGLNLEHKNEGREQKYGGKIKLPSYSLWGLQTARVRIGVRRDLLPLCLPR